MLFRQRYFLSNFYPIKIAYAGYEWPTVEHAYQAAKTHDPDEKQLVLQASSPGSAKVLGSHSTVLTLRNDWNKIRNSVMQELLAIKFQRPNLLRRLKQIEGPIVHENTWHDNYWGKCLCRICSKYQTAYTDHLGQMLTNIRDTN